MNSGRRSRSYAAGILAVILIMLLVMGSVLQSHVYAAELPTEESLQTAEAVEETTTSEETTTVEETATAEETLESEEFLDAATATSDGYTYEATNIGGRSGVNGYLEYAKVYSSGVYNYDYTMITVKNGAASNQLAYCLNIDYDMPQNKYYADTYINATNADFLAVANTATLSVDQSRVRNTIMRCIYYGYPYNKAPQDFLAQATSKYGIPNASYTNSQGVTQNLAEEALRYATQLAIWYTTDKKPAIYSLPSANRAIWPLYQLAYAIYTQAVADNATAPDLEIDIYTPTGLRFDTGQVLTNDAQAMLATRVPAKIVNEPKTSLGGQKTWDDAGHESERPESITVHLYETVMNATRDTGKTMEVTAENGWSYSFENLPKYSAGSEIVYSVQEDNVDPHYIVTINGNNITNTYQTIFDGSPVMPETGGVGTRWFTIGGLMIICAAIAVAVSKKKRG